MRPILRGTRSSLSARRIISLSAFFRTRLRGPRARKVCATCSTCVRSTVRPGQCALSSELWSDSRSWADLLGSSNLRARQVGRKFDSNHIFVARCFEGGDVRLGNRSPELLEERSDGDGVAGSLIVGAAAGAFCNLRQVALPAEAGGFATNARVAVVDRVDGDACALGVGDSRINVGAVLVQGADAPVIRVNAVGEHHDEAGLGGLDRVLPLGRSRPVLGEIGEAEVRARAGARGAHRDTEVFGCTGIVSGEFLGGHDAAVFHVADEDFGPLRKGRDEVANVVELATYASAETVVDEEGYLGSGGRDGGKARERSRPVVDLNDDVLRSWGLGGFGIQSNEGLSTGGAFLSWEKCCSE